MKIDRIILDVDCNTPDCFNWPQRQYSTHIQRVPPIKGSEIGGSWGIRLLTRTSTPFSKQKKTKVKKAIHLGDHPAVCIAVKGKCVFKRIFGTAKVKPRQNGRKMTSFWVAMGWHGQAGSWRGQ